MGLAKRSHLHPVPQAVRRCPIDPRPASSSNRAVQEDLHRSLRRRHAINLQMLERIEESRSQHHPGTGFKTFDAKRTPDYGTACIQRVYGARGGALVNASAHRRRMVLRDGRTPKTVGIVHCVGSRDRTPTAGARASAALLAQTRALDQGATARSFNSTSICARRQGLRGILPEAAERARALRAGGAEVTDGHGPSEKQAGHPRGRRWPAGAGIPVDMWFSTAGTQADASRFAHVQHHVRQRRILPRTSPKLAR